MNIAVNEILQDVSTKEMFRILWIDSGNIICYLIDIDRSNKTALPFKRKVSDVIDDIIQEEIIKIKDDPYKTFGTEIDDKDMKMRDEAWTVIEKIVNDEPAVYEKKTRSQHIKDAMEVHNASYPAVRKYLRKYWQRGMTKNALLPDYHRSGGKGKEKSVGSKKRGRPRKYDNPGINVDEATKKIFRVALEKYYLTTKENYLSDAYKMMIREFYATDFYFENGAPKVELADKDKLPTLTQFKYWYKKEYDVQHTTIARKGITKYQKDFREVLGSSTQETEGPGSRFQIDATVANVYLVSRYNSDWIIGRPVVYLVVDVFSRMITGMYVGLEGPSWMGAMMALANTTRDKYEFCKEYGIEVPKIYWPCEHLPEVLLADRGEFEGYNTERLITAFNLHVENAAPYRADWKGIVEKQFDITQKKVKPFVPGYIDTDFRERGARDYRLDAKLNIYQFTQLMIKQVIAYNTKHYLQGYVRDEEMVRDNVQPIPLDLWNWGIENRSGKLRYFPEDTVKLYLLPEGLATVTYKGIKFKNMYYSCERAIKESWFPNSKQNGSWKVKVSYDPRDMSKIYIYQDHSGFEKAHLLKHQHRYNGYTMDEINYLLEYEKQSKYEAEYGQLKKDINLMNEMEDIINDAVKKANEDQSKSISNREKTSKIQQHRKLEKELQKKEEAFVQEEKEASPDNVLSFDKGHDQNTYERPTIKEFLRKKKR